MRNALIATAAFALIALHGAPASAAPADARLTSIDYLITTQKQAYSVSASVYAAYVGSCLNADAKTPSVDTVKRSAVYVCLVQPQVVSEMQGLKFIPNTVGYRMTHDVTGGR